MKKLVMVLTAIGVACVAGCGGGGGGDDWSGDGSGEYAGKIVFSCCPYQPGASTVYHLNVINGDGSGKAELPFSGKSSFAPAWSPGNVGIAYFADDENNKEKIFLRTPDGKTDVQLTRGDGRDKFPTWSPDGKRIAYISYRDNVPNLFVINVDGGSETQLTFASGGDTVLWPRWSPSGDVIAYTFNSAQSGVGQRIRTIRPDGSGMAELAGPSSANLGDSEPDWSPDGLTLYFLSNRNRHMEIWKVGCNAAGNEFSAPVQISSLSAAGVQPDHTPRVSPDGSKIVFYGTGADWNDVGYNLYTLNTDGSGLVNITRSRDASEWADW